MSEGATDNVQTEAGTQSVEEPTAPDKEEGIYKEPKAEPEQEAQEEPSKEQPEGGEEKPAAETEAQGPYADLRLPEGYEIDREALGSFTELAQADNLPLESVQKYIDLFVNQIEQTASQWNDAIETQVADQSLAWGKEAVKAGFSEGSERLTTAARALEGFGSPELTELLDEGLGNYLPILEFFERVGAAITEDSLVTNQEPVASERPKRGLDEGIYRKRE